MSKDVVLSYKNCILRKDDIELLEGPCWLNDALIAFYFEYLEARYKNGRYEHLFICPELTQLLKLTDTEDYPAFLEPLDAKKKHFIYFPVNDCNSRSESGGTHWSLVVYSQRERTCFHFDSSDGMNLLVARDFSVKVMNYLLDGKRSHYVNVPCPRQDNGHDCGLYVLAYTEIVAQHALKAGKVDGCDYERVKNLVLTKRQSLLQLIEQLKVDSQD